MDALPKIFCIVDTETTGMRPPFSRIVDLGLIRVEEGKVVKRYQTLLNPQMSIPNTVSRIHGITDDTVQDAPIFDEVALEVQEILQGAVFVAHNASFDIAFVKAEFRRLGIDFDPPTLCSVALSRALYPKVRGHSLDAITERFGIRITKRHRALPDAEAVWKFLQRATKEISHDTVLMAVQYVLGSEGLERRTLGELPKSAGVYFFYGKDRELLYIGKSKNIRGRARSHFTAGDSGQGKEHILSTETEAVEALETSGELSALLLEASLIKKESPTYNRMLKKRRGLIVARRTQGVDGYDRITLERSDVQDPDPNILSIFRSTSQAKAKLHDLAREHMLCEKMLGTEKTQGICFKAQLGVCTACTGVTPANEYNNRLEKAFDSRRLKAWPYKGTIMIDEKADADRGTVFFIDNWRLLASYKYDQGAIEVFLQGPGSFDYDSYKILARYLRIRKNRTSIQVLTARAYQDMLARYVGEHEATIV